MPNPFISVINSLLPEPQASLLNGILFGIKAAMPKAFYQSLVTTGVLHMIALSGMNISILTSLTANVTLYAGRKKSSLITVLIISLFVLFVGPSPSIVRAAIMGSLTLLAIYFGRMSWAILSLLLASGIMLLIDPSLIGNLSFQLSFLATLGIIVSEKIRIIRGSVDLISQFKYSLKENLKITLFAQLFTLPVILINFRRLSLIAPLANLLVGWLMQPVMVMGFVLCILGSVWQPLGYLPAWMVWVPLTYFIKVVELLAMIPFASINL